MKKILFASVSLAAGVALAVPEVTSVTMDQPGGAGPVTITYRLSEPAVVTLDIVTNGVSIGGANICSFRAGSDVFRKVETDGTKTIVWKPRKDVRDQVLAGAKAVVKAWALDSTPDFMVVDLQAETASADRVRYYPSKEFLPGGLFENEAYRTTKIVMKRVHAKGVSFLKGDVVPQVSWYNPTPVYRCDLANDYYLAVFETTQGQHVTVTGANPSAYKAGGALFPAESISLQRLRYNDHGCAVSDDSTECKGGLWPNPPYANSILGLFRARTGVDFDLPSETEWEYAARAGNSLGCHGDGTRIPLSNGQDTNLDSFGLYKLNGGSELGHPVAVGSYHANSWGFYDMEGNVDELVLDWAGPGKWGTLDEEINADISMLHGRLNIDPTDGSKTLKNPEGGNAYSAIQKGGCYAECCDASRPGYRGVTVWSRAISYQGYRLTCRMGLK